MCGLNQATNTVSAHFSSTAIGVIQHQSQSIPRLDFKEQQTIGANSETAIAPTLSQFGPAERCIGLSKVDDQKVVAKAVMFGEIDLHRA
jgi:hypothetical protein